MSEPIEVDLETLAGTVHVGRAFVTAKRGVITTNFTYSPGSLGCPTVPDRVQCDSELGTGRI